MSYFPGDLSAVVPPGVPPLSVAGWAGPENYDTLESFADLPIWVTWRYENRTLEGKPTKVPYTTAGFRASSSNPKGWDCREAVEKAVAQQQGGGIGVSFCGLPDGSALCGKDLDKCILPDGSITPWAAYFVELLDSYTEVSPSGTGLKIFFRVPYVDHLDLMGEVGFGGRWVQDGAHDGGEHAPAVELYTARRYFTVTGKLLPGARKLPIRLIDPFTWRLMLHRLGPKPKTTITSRNQSMFSDGDEVTDEETLMQKVRDACEVDLRLKRLADDGKFRNPTDRSACAWELGKALFAHGELFNYSEFVYILSKHPKTQAWTYEKGFANDERELKRIWDRAPEWEPLTPAQLEFEGHDASPGGNDGAPGLEGEIIPPCEPPHEAPRGSDDLRFQIDYIKEFNRMEAELLQKASASPTADPNDPAALRDLLIAYDERVIQLPQLAIHSEADPDTAGVIIEAEAPPRDPGTDAPRPSGFRVGVIQVLTPDDCETAVPRAYVIKGLIGSRDTALLSGAPGSGKSCVAPDLGYAVAQGRRFHGMRVKQGPVVYIAAEDGEGMRVRVRALRKKFGRAPDFYLVPDPIDLFAPLKGSKDGMLPDAVLNKPLAGLRKLIEDKQPILIIVDTVAASFPGMKENDGSDGEGMGRAKKVSRDLTKVCGSAVLMLHHMPHGAERARGSTVLPADVDVDMIITVDKDTGVRSIRFHKNRNGASDRVLNFAINVEHLGADADGDPITAVTAQEVIKAPAAKPSEAEKAERALSAITKKALDVLRGMAPAGTEIAEAKWQEECDKARISAAKTPKDREQAFRRTHGALIAAGFITVENEIVELVDNRGAEFRAEAAPQPARLGAKVSDGL